MYTLIHMQTQTRHVWLSIYVKYWCLIYMYMCILVALPSVSDLELYEVTDNSMRARWRDAEGASGYMILYAPLSSDTTDEREVRLQIVFVSVPVCVRENVKPVLAWWHFHQNSSFTVTLFSWERWKKNNNHHVWVPLVALFYLCFSSLYAPLKVLFLWYS